MATLDIADELSLVLDTARESGRAQQLPYAGGVPPQQAWSLLAAGAAVLVDVRSAEERTFVGQVPGSVHVPWATGTQLIRNPRFLREMQNRLPDRDSVLLLLCRSGKRSAPAAALLAQAGYTQVFNVLEGFEGDLDARQRRGQTNGWRWHGLPWLQD